MRRRTLFYAKNNLEPESSYSDTGVQPFSDNEDGTDTCVVCGTFDKVLKLQVLERGSGGKMNVTKLLSLFSYYRIKSKSIENISICQKDKKAFFNYFDYYVLERY